MSIVALLGDSIFDNARYVSEAEKPVSEQLQSVLQAGSKVYLLAVDGSVTTDVTKQIKSIPNGTTHLAISSGGNDALEARSLIYSSRSPDALLGTLTMIQGEFRMGYENLVSAVKRTGIPAIVCTIYDSIPNLSPVEKTLLSLFNDVIVVQAFRAGFPVIDLRSLCDDPGDYSEISSIEPSAQGGMKIAERIAQVLESHDLNAHQTIFY